MAVEGEGPERSRTDSGSSSASGAAESSTTRKSSPKSKPSASRTPSSRSRSGSTASAGRRKRSASPPKSKPSPAASSSSRTDTLCVPTWFRPYQITGLTESWHARDAVIISAPQLGKTELARFYLIARAFVHGPDDRPWWWTAPTYAQARHGFSGLVRHARSLGLLQSYTSTPPLECRLNFGAVIEARSWDRPEGMYGPSVLGGVSDEFGWGLTAPAYSAISSRRAETITQGFGRWLWIGNVGHMGGSAENLWQMAEAGRPGFIGRRWTWRDRAAAHQCPCGNGAEVPTEIDTANDHGRECPRGIYLRFLAREKERMSRVQFATLYDAEWADWNELPVYEFDRAVHVDESVCFDPHLPMDVSCDFNVDPMGWVLGQHKGPELWAFDEVAIPGGATTRAACEEIIRRYPDRKIHVNVYGDASGKARTTRSRQTDYDIIREILGGHYLSVTVHVPASNPAVTDRVNAVNAKLRSAAGDVLYRTHPRCRQLITDRARVSFKPGTRDIDKSDKNRTHFSDADDYRVAELYPVQLPAPISVGVPGMGFEPMGESIASAGF